MRISSFRFQDYLRLSVIVCSGLALRVATAAAEIPSDPAPRVTLDGLWRFKLEQPGPPPPAGRVARPPAIVRPAQAEPFERLDYAEDQTWRELKVPGNWEMAGYSPATYWQPDNAIGLYRRWFEVPAEWAGQTILLNFDGVQNGAEVFLNGQPVDVDEPAWGRRNAHEGGWDAFQVDLTPAVKFGARNLLAVRVAKNTRTSDLDSGDYFFLGGIHRSVTLFPLPKVHIRDLVVQTTLLEGGRANVRVVLELGAAGAGAAATMSLPGHNRLSARANTQGAVEFNQPVERPRLWSAEHPELYELVVELQDEHGKNTERLVRRIGIRQVTIRDGVLLVNGTPVKLAGICRHDLHPTQGTAVDEELWRKDLTLMKAANINAIRTSHYPYGARFYDLCDELGFYVADEMSGCWVSKTIDSDEYSPAFRQRARELVRRDRNHPSVIIWAIGNENDKGRNNRVAADQIRALDPTRPRLVSRHDAEEGGVEMDDRHYRTPERIAAINNAERARTYPHALLENPNVWEARNGADFGCTDLWGHVIDRSWREIWKDEHVPGSFLWEWHDRSIRDPHPTHLYEHDTATALSFVKTKGICDGYRNPRASYYHLKMAYSPVWIEPAAEISPTAVTLDVTNRYSFTDLAELDVNWHLVAGGRATASGSSHLGLPSRTRRKVSLTLPAAALAAADILRLELQHRDGRNVATYQFPIKPAAPPALPLEASDLGGIKFPQFNLVTVVPNGWQRTPPHFARLSNIAIERASGGAPVALEEQALYDLPLAEIRALEADVVMVEPPSKKVARVRAEYHAGAFSYRLTWVSNRAQIQELGWMFELPKTWDHFSWNRQALWSWYPSTHIGRPEGTATPDSAKVNFTHYTRPDAFDFNSTKYDCHWARLADAGGRGLGIMAAGDKRPHCRGDFSPAGDFRLVVNRYCCPPHDISSGTVRDFYFAPENGTVVEAAFKVGLTR